ncbi:MAG: cupin domain-containing protein, partial [Lysobacterales bacterium]
TSLPILAGVGVLALACVLALKTGLARRVFFAVFAYVKGSDLLAPTILNNPPVNSPYQRWLDTARKAIPVVEGRVLHDIEHVALQAWPQMGEGATGLYLHFAGYQMIDGAVLQIPVQGKTASQRHLYEKGIYILSGVGYAILQQEGKPPRRMEWGSGDLFSVPLNVRHQIHNTGHEPARMVVVSSFPLILNLFNSASFVESNSHVFTDRYEGTPDFLESVRELTELELAANFVKDIRHTALRPNEFRGKGNKSIRWLMAGNSMLSMHISEIPPKTIKKAHRITSNAFVLTLSGEGFSVFWREGAYDDRERVDWKPGTLFAPPVFWYQQHLNTGLTPARYLAINVPGMVRNIGLHLEDQLEVDIKEVKIEWNRELERASSKQQ